MIYLKRAIATLEHKKESLDDVSTIRRIEDEILKLQGGLLELRQWGRELDLDPGYGKLIRCTDGMHRPKLPVFESKQQREAALNNRAGTLTGLKESDVRRAREFRAREDAEVSIKNMDGRSPYITEEERKPPRGSL
jgi:hypothetical protein